MSLLIIGGIFVVLSVFFLIVLIEDAMNKNDEFFAVKDWHNFRNTLDKSQGEK